MGMWMFAKIVAQGIKKAIPCERVGVAVVGLEVAHAHIHLVPINAISDLNFEKPKLEFSEDDMLAISEEIRESISKVTHG